MRQTILVIDDDAGILRVLAYELGHDAYDVTGVGSGEDALTHVANQSFDLILLDVGLPDCNGFDLYHRLREFTKAPIVFLTGRGECIDRIAGLEQGADDYLPKPFDIRELQARIRVILRRTRGVGQEEIHRGSQDPEPPTLNRGPFDLDEDRMLICYHTTPVDFTHHEYQILRALLLHPGRVISRAKLLEAISVDPDGPYERVIDSHISAIRAKLRSIDPLADPIITRRNAGYVLQENEPCDPS